MGAKQSGFKQALIRERLLPLSFEQNDLEKALSEWYWNGDVRDMKEEHSKDDFDGRTGYHVSCELCDQPNLRYVFTIVNKINQAELLVGSECYKDFDEEQYGLSDKKDRGKKIEKAKRRCIKDSNIKKGLRCLERIRPILNSNEVDDWMRHYQMNGSFEPDQLLLILGLFRLGNIECSPKLFKLSIKRNREKVQLKKMDRKGIETLWDSMSSGQKNWYKKNLQTIKE